MKKITKLLFLIGICLSIFGISISSAIAIEYGGFGIRPAYPRKDNPRTESIYVHILNPGEIKKDGVLVINNTEETKTLIVYAADSTRSSGGGFACKQLSEPKTNVGSWIELKKDELTLESGQKELIPFTINIPENIDVGEHNGCILIQEKKESPGTESGVSFSVRTGLRIAITIPGDITKKLEIVGFDVKKSSNEKYNLHPSVKNLGNVSVDADIKVATKNIFGKNYAENGGQFPILRGETSEWNFELKRPFWGGLYKSVFTVEYDPNTNVEIGKSSGEKLVLLKHPPLWFFVMPQTKGMIIEIAVIVLILVIIFFILFSKKRKKWISKSWVEYEVKNGEDIRTIAEKFDVSWKLLVKINKLKPPYTLRVGGKIKVPPIK